MDEHVVSQVILESYRDLRDEIKRRVDERNRYVIQSVVATGALLTFAFSDKMRPLCSAVACFVGMGLTFLYYRLIKRSYTIGESIKEYLRSKIEPRLFEMTKIMPWQMYREEIRKHDPKKARETMLSDKLSLGLALSTFLLLFAAFIFFLFGL